jgi:hypothetical protein
VKFLALALTTVLVSGVAHASVDMKKEVIGACTLAKGSPKALPTIQSGQLTIDSSSLDGSSKTTEDIKEVVVNPIQTVDDNLNPITYNQYVVKTANYEMKMSFSSEIFGSDSIPTQLIFSLQKKGSDTGASGYCYQQRDF